MVMGSTPIGPMLFFGVRVYKKSSLVDIIYHSAVEYPAPSNISYNWNYGVLAFVCLFVQVLTGIFLAMHYVSCVEFAFNSVEHIMRDVNNGWFLRYAHANGASMFFIVVYLHMFRGMYYQSYFYPRRTLWCTGVLIFLIMVATAFIGYVLPWGQMSLWGATVITNLVSTIPYIGKDVVVWLWGGFAVDNATLNRFFSLHYLMPFVLVGLVLIHFIVLHETGSSNPLGVGYRIDNIPFGPYFIVKDTYSVLLFMIFFSTFIFFMPDTLGHPDNYIPANPLVTPTHIVPEWYFLWFYAILRSIPDKAMGVLAVAAAIGLLFALPFFVRGNVTGVEYRPLSKVLFWFFVLDFLVLIWVGGKPVEEPYFTVGYWATVFFFLYFKASALSVYLEDKFWSRLSNA